MRSACILAAMIFAAGLAQAQVPFDRIKNSDKEPGNWLSYSRDVGGQRYSPLDQINTRNVGQLKVEWALQLPTGRNEVSPIAVDGQLFITGPNTASAVDAKSGRVIWTWRRSIPANFKMNGFAAVSRGPAVLDDKIYVATIDGFLVALDIRTGIERWSTKVAPWEKGYGMTVAPLAVEDKIVVGVSGGEAGVRGFLDAYDAKSGQRAWRFWTVPEPGAPGNETWSGESWKTGGGPTWVTGSYDKDTGVLYWGVGNPSPDWNGDMRLGDNLYTCSLLALDLKTGKLRWHFQFVPHDTHDWDAAHVPVLFDGDIDGKPRKLVAVANRNAFYYVLDRITGEFLVGKPYAKQTWAKGLDAKGRPITDPAAEPTEAGVLVWPNVNGATVWMSPSYSPRTGLVYVATREVPSIYYKRKAEYEEGEFFAGGAVERQRPEEDASAIRALRAETGDLVWEHKLFSPPWSGVLSTAGGLVFSGSDEGNIYALDDSTGKVLWNFQAGGAVTANPMSFTVDGRQLIAMPADRVLYIFGLGGPPD